MVDHPPPPEFMLRTERPVDFPQFYVRTESSYPSGHSGRTMFIAVLLLVFLYYSRYPLVVKVLLGSAILGYVGIMLVSRIYLGEHWMTDVVGGSLLACSFSLISLAFLQRNGRKMGKKPENKPISASFLAPFLRSFFILVGTFSLHGDFLWSRKQIL
jgi:membrane-associated phospholipid phosphatase